MLRALAILLIALQAHPAPAESQARCDGRDLIMALPAPERRTLESRAAAQPHAEGLLWRASRGNTRITLFGTYHYQHRKTGAHLDRLKPMIEAAQTVYLEMSPEDQAAFRKQLAEDPSTMFITQGETLPDLLGPEDWQDFAAEMEKRRIPSVVAAKFKPLWAAMMLGVGPCEARNGAMNASGIDALLGEHATQTGVETRSLEDFAQVLGRLDDQPLEKQVEMIRLTLAWPGDADDMSHTIRTRYLAGQVALTWEYSRMVSLEHGGPTAAADFARLEDILLTDRNRAWVEKLLAEVPGSQVLVAVGAGHLPGKAGLLHLLEKAGFTVERLPL